MSQPAVAALAPQPLDFEIVFDDGEPLESPWHYDQIDLLYHQLRQARTEQGRSDVYIGANQFVYYSVEQAREVAAAVAQGRREDVRGPDVFWISGVDPWREREGWVAWEEGGRLPDVIFELWSKSNTLAHRRKKKELYAEVFGTAEYFAAGRKGRRLDGFRLEGGEYRPIEPDGRGWLWSEQLGLFVGLWHGRVGDQEAGWVRLYRPDGTLVPTPQEQAEAERQRAEAERQRAEEERQRAEAADQRAETERQRADAADQRAEHERRRAEDERRRAEAAEAELARLRALVQDHGRD
jgi:Uma2 family endonuclease